MNNDCIVALVVIIIFAIILICPKIKKLRTSANAKRDSKLQQVESEKRGKAMPNLSQLLNFKQEFDSTKTRNREVNSFKTDITTAINDIESLITANVCADSDIKDLVYILPMTRKALLEMAMYEELHTNTTENTKQIIEILSVSYELLKKKTQSLLSDRHIDLSTDKTVLDWKNNVL